MDSNKISTTLIKSSAFIFGEFQKKQFIVFSIGAALTFILELVSYLLSKSHDNSFSIVASRLWMLGLIAVIISFIGIIAMQIRDDIKNKKVLLPIIFLLIVVFFSFQVGNFYFSDLSYESTQEVNAGLEAFKNVDWNYTGTGFTGYPIKQYLMNAIPSILFGRSFFALNAGFAIPFILGLTILFIELRRFLKFIGSDERLAILPILMISFCPYIDDFYYIFEQTLTPVSYSMIVIALFLRVIRRPSLFSFSLLAFNACMLPFLYTPALALMGLVMVITLYHALMVFLGKSEYSKRDKRDLKYIISVAITGILPILFFVCTLINKRHDDFLSPLSDETSKDVIKSYYHGLISFFVDSSSIFFGIFGAIVLIYLLASISMRIRFHNLIISLWCFATAYFAFMLPGASKRFGFNYDLNVLEQRCMVIVPILAVAILFSTLNFIKKHNISMKNSAVIIVSLAFLLFGVNTLFTQHKGFAYNNYIQNMKYMIKYSQDMLDEKGIKYDDEFCLIIHSDNGLFHSPTDFARYFYPNAKIYRFPINDAGGISIYDAIFPKFVITESKDTENYYYLEFTERKFKNIRYDSNPELYFRYIDPDYSYVSMYSQDYIIKYNLQQYVKSE